MNNPLGVSPSKGNREPHEAKKKSFDLGGNRTHDLRIRSSVTLPTELQGQTEKVGDDFRWWIAAKRKQGSGLDLPSLCRLSYKVRQRKSGTILDGESRQRESKGTYECCAA